MSGVECVQKVSPACPKTPVNPLRFRRSSTLRKASPVEYIIIDDIKEVYD
jgi:hypothetical protein